MFFLRNILNDILKCTNPFFRSPTLYKFFRFAYPATRQPRLHKRIIFKCYFFTCDMFHFLNHFTQWIEFINSFCIDITRYTFNGIFNISIFSIRNDTFSFRGSFKGNRTFDTVCTRLLMPFMSQFR